jgi:hypothetical protein
MSMLSADGQTLRSGKSAAIRVIIFPNAMRKREIRSLNLVVIREAQRKVAHATPAQELGLCGTGNIAYYSCAGKIISIQSPLRRQ